MSTRLKRRYPQAGGEWETPARTYKMMCCDCGLVHTVRLRLVKVANGGRQIQWFINRDDRATAGARRGGGRHGHGILTYPNGMTYMLIYLGKRKVKKRAVPPGRAG